MLPKAHCSVDNTCNLNPMKKTSFHCLLAYSFILLLLSGCVASSVSTESNAIYNQDAALGDVKTFAFFQPVPVATADFQDGFSAGMDEKLKRALKTGLQQKGIQEVATEPDILVAYDVSVAVPPEKERSENYLAGFGYGYAYMAGYRFNYKNDDLLGYRSIDLYKQGTLVIDLIDADSKKLLWRGWAEGALTNPDVRYKTIENHVTEMLKKLAFKR